MNIAPYRSTPVFDEESLPAALRHNHSTKAGVWGVIHVREGQLRLVFTDPPSQQMLDADHPGYILPQQVHYVEPVGPVKMQVDFYDQPPDG